MIKEIILKDFFSFRDETHILLKRGANILLGINGSGKTTFLNSLKLLSMGATEGGFNKLFQQKWGGYYAVANMCHEDLPNNIELTFVFDGECLSKFHNRRPYNDDVYYKICITPVGTQSYAIEEEIYVMRGNSEYKNTFLHVTNGEIRLGVEQDDGTIHTEKYPEVLSDKELSLSQIKDPDKYFLLYAIQNVTATMSHYDTFDTSSDSRIRRPSAYSTPARINADGDNLVQWLSNAKNNELNTYRKIEEYLHKVNPNFEGLDFNNFGNLNYMSLVEKRLSRTIGMSHISEGTIRFMLLLSILLNKQRGVLVGIDEPEGGLHPDMIYSVAELIQKAAQTSQIIIATHSPLLLNAFELDDVIVFEKDEDNSTIVKYCDEDALPEAESVLPGQLWINGLIGGKRW